MVELVGVHGADQRDVVRHRADAGQQVAEFHAALAVWLEFALGSHQHRRLLFDEGEPYVGGHFLGQRFAAQFVQLGLGIEEVDVTRCAGHENENTALGLGRKVWPDVRQWVALGGEQVVLLKQRRQCCHADSACAGCQKIAPCKLSPIAGCLWINPLAMSYCCAGNLPCRGRSRNPGMRSKQIFDEFGRPGDYGLAALHDDRPLKENRIQCDGRQNVLLGGVGRKAKLAVFVFFDPKQVVGGNFEFFQ